MAASTNIHGFNIGGNNNSFDQRGHFYRAFLDGNVSGMLVKQNSTPNMTVLVEHGSALLDKNTISASVAEIKSDTSVTIDTANTSNPRIDTVVIYEDTSVAIPTIEADYWQDGAGGRFKIISLPGTAGAAPVALSDANIQTAIGAGKPWARLADITVPTNSTTIINSNINNNVRSKLGVPLKSVNGGTTAGVLTTDASGNVTVQPEWASWTPTFTNFTKGSASISCAYIKIGKFVHFRLSITLAADSVMGTEPRFTLPVTSVSYPGLASVQNIGVTSYIDTGIAQFRGEIVWSTTTTATLQALDASGSYVGPRQVTATAPFTWANTDVIWAQGTYEAA